MSDFCKTCSEEMFKQDYGDLSNLCKEGECAEVLCENCGWIFVNHLGEKVPDVQDPNDDGGV